MSHVAPIFGTGRGWKGSLAPWKKVEIGWDTDYVILQCLQIWNLYGGIPICFCLTATGVRGFRNMFRFANGTFYVMTRTQNRERIFS